MSGLQADPALAARLGSVLGNRHSRFAVATVSGGNVSVAAAGVPLDADFEIGSISKGITGLLYTDACERGEISPGMTLGELLPLGDCEAAQVTLASVSRHSSGLPRLPDAVHPLRRTFALWLRGTPAGGLRATVEDMGRLTRALLDGSAPGISALDPVADFAGPAVRIGAAWITLEAKGRSLTWHNGATGGFNSWIGLDRDANTGVVLMSATSASVDRHGFRLLEELTHP